MATGFRVRGGAGLAFGTTQPAVNAAGTVFFYFAMV